MKHLLMLCLLKKSDRNILVDTGEGFYDEENAGKLVYSLTAAGFTPESVTDILITHAHGDHIGGILSKNGDFVFPNARYYISSQEFEFWTSDELDFQKSKTRKEESQAYLWLEKFFLP